jgi:hypothetical protein
MKRFLLLFAASSLLMATPATAKVIEAVELCGKSECRSVPKSKVEAREAHDWVFGGASASAAAAGDGPPRAASRWRALITVGDGSEGGPSETFGQLIAPEAGYLRVDGAWRRMSTTAAREWTRLAKGLEPLALPKPATQETGTDRTVPPPQETSTEQAAAGAGTDAWPWVAVGAAGLGAMLLVWRRRHRGIR